jgi:SpoVK/Ycf46/Vps4 family AAA+-type ATPase
MSARHDMFFKHNLTDEQIKNIDKIILNNSASITQAYFEYHRVLSQINEKYYAKQENRNERIISIDEVKSKYRAKEITSVHARVYPYNLTDEELEQPIYNLYGYEFKDWILDILKLDKLLEIGNDLFALVLSKSTIKIDSYKIGLGIWEIEMFPNKYIAMRKFVYSLVKLFDVSNDYKAMYIGDEAYQEGVYEDIIDGFEEKNKSFQELYNYALKYDYIDAVNPPKEKDWINKSTMTPIIIDDFRDFKELENM